MSEQTNNNQNQSAQATPLQNPQQTQPPATPNQNATGQNPENQTAQKQPTKQNQEAQTTPPKKATQKISRKHIPGYTLIKPLGKGGMATVYSATQDSFGREVAIKIMAPELIDKKDFATRFEMEARMVAKLSHPNIVTVYDVGLVGKNYYLAMELHPNGHLGDKIKAGMQPKEALLIAKKLAGALHFAHEHSIVHRDLKPDNILFSQHHEPVITDFGIARDNSSDTNLTQVGSTVGTPKYMSPEQAKGERVDGRSDVYGLGVILYEMITGEPPFQADDPVALAIKHCKDPIPRLPLMLEEYQPIIDRMMNKNRDKRFADGNSVIKAIEALEKELSNEGNEPVSDSNKGDVEITQVLNKPLASDSEYKTLTQNKKPTAEPEQAPVKKAITYQTEDYESGFLFFKKITREITFSAKDYEQFESIFNKACKEIGQWHKSKGRKAKQIDFIIEAHPWIHNRILTKLNQNFPEQHPYGAFCSSGTVTVHLFDDVDKKGDRYLIRDNGKIPDE